jgi:hypothetical protein
MISPTKERGRWIIIVMTIAKASHSNLYSKQIRRYDGYILMRFPRHRFFTMTSYGWMLYVIVMAPSREIGFPSTEENVKFLYNRKRPTRSSCSAKLLQEGKTFVG